jgi:hypothetical protein
VVASSFTFCDFASALKCSVGSVADGSTPFGGFMDGRNSLGLLLAGPLVEDRPAGRDDDTLGAVPAAGAVFTIDRAGASDSPELRFEK